METKLEDGTELTSYLACGLAEGFEESEGETDCLRAWSYLIGTGLCWQLQGWYGREANRLIESGYINPNGTIDWERINLIVESELQ